MNNIFKDIQVMILCGGKGTRLRDVTEILPKPMVNIGEFPIVVHIMKWYAKFGIKRFILCLGYKKESFIEYFLNFKNFNYDITIDCKNDRIIKHNFENIDWEITLADTGLESKTALRVFKAAKYLKENSNFFLTYGDGISNIDINSLYLNHISSKKLLTLSAVKNPSRFGTFEFNTDDTIKSFDEKTKSNGYINGGFMVINKKFIEKYVNGDDVFFEADPMTLAIKDNNINAYKHNGFWQCMDNAKEYSLLNDLWNKGNAPWK